MTGPTVDLDALERKAADADLVGAPFILLPPPVLSALAGELRAARRELAERQASEAGLVFAAWLDPGPMPHYHRDMQNRLRREWPTLARALDRVVRP